MTTKSFDESFRPTPDSSGLAAVFVGHGSPMNAIEENSFTRSWNEIGKQATPRAVLSVSAHWYTQGTGVTAMEHPRTIHDFWGFPDELNRVVYGAPGDPEIAALVEEVAKPTLVSQDHSWGLDHGTWSVLRHIYPEANIPVIQLSIDGTKPYEEHFALGARLATLAKENNVLILGSGNVVHNLRMYNPHMGDAGFEWADRFDEKAHELMLASPDRIPQLYEDPDFMKAVPTPDHFLPLAYIAGVADALGGDISAFNESRTGGSLSMTGYAVTAKRNG
ncbi:4,5-DOPA dioxygenase extradiol [Corynebacterium sp. SCR221107]|uniref:4,5-DOPA-extradiol-dioxygenase n=1 Tax=Corynebacterium sp. SCR221107 TaxID=3017361 RepID=UPI0022EC20DD|nr:4,5-DOPA dioxygenase extradiol [Corynebacterium sp. SCR221107]WBT09195.1 4,5-DOPA dioxygenase extradiol [Corynebacterium sp. SCR221107]